MFSLSQIHLKYILFSHNNARRIQTLRWGGGGEGRGGEGGLPKTFFGPSGLSLVQK